MLDNFVQTEILGLAFFIDRFVKLCIVYKYVTLVTRTLYLIWDAYMYKCTVKMPQCTITSKM